MTGHSNLFHVGDADFEQKVLNSETPTIVDFWASWCGPCRAMAPIFEQLSDKYAGKLQFAKIDIDEHDQTPTRYNVRSIPTLIVFKNGEVAGRLVGLLPAARLESEIEKILTGQVSV
jgi:thioredoxin 1